ncbi:MAG: hypothetical protein ACFE0O_15570 [Opitutales bacterium]
MDSTKYIEQYKVLHQNPNYGKSGEGFSLIIEALASEIKPKSILDFGAGKSQLIKKIKFPCKKARYDPAIPDIAELPEMYFDLVINTDVMEHIPSNNIENVLRSIKEKGKNAFFNIATRSANAILPNGENAHCSVLTSEEWLELIKGFYPKAKVVWDKPNFSCIILTWNSCLDEVVEGLMLLEEVKGDIRRIDNILKKFR